jgi:hypothetical protein
MSENISTEVILRKALTATDAYSPGAPDKILAAVEVEVGATPVDPTTKKGREAIASLAYKVTRSKTALDELGEELAAEWKKKSNEIDAIRRKFRNSLDNLRDRILAPKLDWESKDARRREEHETQLVVIRNITALPVDYTVELVEARLLKLEALSNRQWEEYQDTAYAAIDSAKRALHANMAYARNRDAERVELERLRQEQIERDRKHDEEARVAREKRIQEELVRQQEQDRLAEEAAEKARIEREQRIREEEQKRAQEEASRKIQQAEEAARIEQARRKRVEEEARQELERMREENRRVQEERDRLAVAAKKESEERERVLREELESKVAEETQLRDAPHQSRTPSVTQGEREVAYIAYRIVSKSHKIGPWPECGIDAALEAAAQFRKEMGNYQ